MSVRFAVLAAFIAPLALVPSAPVAARTPPVLERTVLQITNSRGAHRFTVEVARTEAQQARGLMFRRTLRPNEGMIFPFRPARPASFWMKNTLIPLDMVFIRGDGTIARIVTAKPLDLTPVDSGEPVVAVLEIAGGRAGALGIRAGDRVQSPALRR